MNDITVNDNLLKNITYKKDESGNPTNEVTDVYKRQVWNTERSKIISQMNLYKPEDLLKEI